MDRLAAFSKPRRSIVAAVALTAIVSIAVGWTARSVAAGSTPATHAPARATAAALGAPEAQGPNLPAADASASTGQTGTASSGTGTSSIAYPVPGYDSLGVAPQGTILVAGTGSADMKVSGSDRAAALQKATTTALGDAKSQASAAAGAMGVTLGDIYSLSLSSSENDVYPIADCLPTPEPMSPDTSAGATGTGTTGSEPASPVVCLPGTTPEPTATSAQIVVTVVVAYRYS